MEKALEHFEKVIFTFFQKTKDKHRYLKEQIILVVMDTSKVQKIFARLWLFRTT